jgi:hypothetical protein
MKVNSFPQRRTSKEEHFPLQVTVYIFSQDVFHWGTLIRLIEDLIKCIYEFYNNSITLGNIQTMITFQLCLSLLIVI